MIYGIGRKQLKTYQVPNYKCETCLEFGSTAIDVHVRYFHIFWIPVLPLGKTGSYSCDKCNFVYKGRKFPERLKFHLSNFKAKTTIPVTLYIGPAIVVLLIMYSVLASSNASENYTRYIADPKTGDVYFYEPGQGTYSAMKVGKATADSVFFFKNKGEATKVMKVFGLDKPENYTTQLSAFSKKELRQMRKDKVIFSITRK